MEEKPQTFELIEPASPEELLPGRWFEPWMIVALVALVCVIAALVIWKKRRVKGDPLAKRKASYEDAKSALARITATDTRGAAVQVSLVLRKYLALAAGDPALFETHEEFISRHDALKDLSETARGAAESGFGNLASLKYAPQTANTEPREVIGDGGRLLETLHHGFQS